MDARETSRRPLGASLAVEIKVALTRRNMRPSDLARALGEADKWVSRRLRGLTPMTIGDLERIARALDTEPADLLKAATQSGVENMMARERLATTADEDRPNGRPESGTSLRPSVGRRPRLMTDLAALAA